VKKWQTPEKMGQKGREKMANPGKKGPGRGVKKANTGKKGINTILHYEAQKGPIVQNTSVVN
jgi:hypothetical protein